MPEDSPVPADESGKRAADVDREATATRLREALSEGRIELVEFDDRLQRAYTAKTYGELDALLSDLPRTRPAADSQLDRVDTPEMVVKAKKDRKKRLRALKGIWGGWGAAAIFFTGLWFLGWLSSDVGDKPNFWPMWILGFWGIGAVIGTWNYFMDDDDDDDDSDGDKKDQK